MRTPARMPSSSLMRVGGRRACSSPCAEFSAPAIGRCDACRPRRESSQGPSVTTYSRPRSAMSCMPTQMPRNGRPLARARWSPPAPRPCRGTASSPRRQSAKAPTPGSTTRSARAHLIRIARHHDRLIVSALLARRALERLRRRMQIARTIIDNRDAHVRTRIMAALAARGNSPMTSETQASGIGALTTMVARAAAGGGVTIASPRDPGTRRSGAPPIS